jgi:hypothetical protein
VRSSRPRPGARRVSLSLAALAGLAAGGGLGLLGPGAARADADADAGAIGGKTWTSCVEHVPQGATRPQIEERFPERGLSGYATSLEVTVKHGKGETVLPEGFKIQASSDAARAIAAAGFAFPDQDGGSGATLSREDTESGAVTKLTIPFVALPKEPGRNEMTLPPVPIAVARANGELITVCTATHDIRVEDPTANESDPKVKPNPPPRHQREEWTVAKQVSIGVLIGAVAMALVAWLFLRWKKAPKPVKLAPRKPPWVIALAELDAIRGSSLLADGKADEYFDRVSDTVRKYLGARYGFDGLESTTDEMRLTLKRVRPPILKLGDIATFLEDCDLVKFARVLPTEDDCLAALDRGEAIVRGTIPPAVLANGSREAA